MNILRVISKNMKIIFDKGKKLVSLKKINLKITKNDRTPLFLISFLLFYYYYIIIEKFCFSGKVVGKMRLEAERIR